MGQYISSSEIRERLLGKVRFTNDPVDENAVGSGLLESLLDEAESEVELRLSVRYNVPFQGDGGEAFNTLPAHTQNQIKTLCRIEGCRRVMQLDFGRGSPTESDKYREHLDKDWEARLERLIEYRKEQFGHFKYPPLPSLQLAAHNDQADDGYAGRIHVTSDDPGAYASVQMPNPGETIWSGHLEDNQTEENRPNDDAV
jgi:hypothetical protein